jgi:hypothetical protein
MSAMYAIFFQGDSMNEHRSFGGGIWIEAHSINITRCLKKVLFDVKVIS